MVLDWAFYVCCLFMLIMFPTVFMVIVFYEMTKQAVSRVIKRKQKIRNTELGDKKVISLG